MKVPYSWLKEHVSTSQSLDSISSILTLAGLEVDAIYGRHPEFNHVVTAKVISCEKHPKSDKLKLTTVFDGKDTYQVVCGASNCRANLITALAKIGATLTAGIKELKIEKGVIREVESFGMLCAKDELGLEEKSEGIIEFPENTELGVPVENLLIDPVFEISLTPNLGHCFSIHGVARELSYFTHEPLLQNEITSIAFKHREEFSIQLASDDVQEFHLAKISNVKIQPSSFWLQEKLKRAGFKPINNVVDALNYAMMEFGQPMHAYDFDKIKTKTIKVTNTLHMTPFCGLDGVLREIPKDVLTICDDQEPIAIAGIMGSFSSMIDESTKTVLIEVASFSSQAIRKGMKKLSLRTEASAHFEKGIDRNKMLLALKKAIQLIQESTADFSLVNYQKAISQPYQEKVISLRPKKVNQLIGLHLSSSEIESILTKIDCKILGSDNDAIKIQIPSFRNDIALEIDLVEEVARIYGFNNIEKSEGFYRQGTVSNSPVFNFENMARNSLLNLGLQELVSCNLISPKLSEIGLSNLKSNQLIHMLHAKSVDQSILRPSLIPTLLQVIKHNQNFQVKDLTGFEIGRVHFYDNEKAQEKFAIGIVCCGRDQLSHFSENPSLHSFFSIKGIVEQLMADLGIHAEFCLSSLIAFHPGQQALIKAKNETIGIIGQIHPNETKKMGIDSPVYFAQLDLVECMHLHQSVKKMQRLSEFPGSTRDITLTLNKVISYEKIMKTIKELNINILQDIECLNIFNSETLGSHKHNITIRLTYRSEEKTLDFETVEKAHKRVYEAVLPLTANE